MPQFYGNGTVRGGQEAKKRVDGPLSRHNLRLWSTGKKVTKP
jgi:hypothetical protein